MKFHEIRIDEDIMEYLRKHAVPYQEKEPNDTLRRLFSLNGKPIQQTEDLLRMPRRLPSALAQILEVYRLVRNGTPRNDATTSIANQRNITTQSVIDKYTRQLGKRAYEIDMLMQPENKEEFKKILIEKFYLYKDAIDEFFSTLN